jgi:hypothetical protein
MDDLKEEKLKRYESEEIKLILFICSTNLYSYPIKEIVSFTECIEGRVEILLTEDKLISLENYLPTSSNDRMDLFLLKQKLIQLYSSQWHTKLKNNTLDWIEIQTLAKRILLNLKISYIKPEIYMQSNLNINW